MSYFCDVLDCQDKQMDFDYKEPFKFDALKDLSVKIKSAPNKETSMSNGMDIVKGKKDGDYDFKYKTEVSHACWPNGNTKVIISNKEVEVTFNWKPEDLNKDGMHSQVEINSKCNPGANTWESKNEFKIGGFKVGPITPYTEVSSCYNLLTIFVDLARVLHQQCQRTQALSFPKLRAGRFQSWLEMPSGLD